MQEDLWLSCDILNGVYKLCTLQSQYLPYKGKIIDISNVIKIF